MSTNSYLSIIIVNYNGGKYLRQCLDSIKIYADCSHEVIVVDNASTDNSCEMLRRHYPEVNLIINQANAGFAAGNNIGGKHARGNILLLLNSDTQLLSPLSKGIVKFNMDKELGVLGCKMSYGDGRFQPSYGFEHTPCRIVCSWIGLRKVAPAPSLFRRTDENEEHYRTDQPVVNWVSGAFLMTRRALWNELGGMDEAYFMYIEEVDYCKRARSLGYRVSFTPEIEIVHYEGGGKAWLGKSAKKNTMRSYMIYTRKFHGLLSQVFVRFGLISVMMARSFLFYGMQVFSSREIHKEKAEANLAAAKILWD